MPSPMPMPNRAVTIGRPMASTEPNATSRMTMAARMPMISLAPGAVCGDRLIGLATQLDLQPVARARPRPCRRPAGRSAFGMSSVALSNCTVV